MRLAAIGPNPAPDEESNGDTVLLTPTTMGVSPLLGAARIEHSQLLSSYIDPASASITVEQWSTRWLTAQSHLKPSTRARHEGITARHIIPTWGRVPLSSVHHADVAAWVSRLSSTGLAGSTVQYVHRVFALMLAMAVKDGRLARNPAAGVRLPERSQVRAAIPHP
jgi:hypothetical protein